MQSNYKVFGLGFLCSAILSFLAWHWVAGEPESQEESNPTASTETFSDAIGVRVERLKIKRNSTVYETLRDAGVSASSIQRLLDSAKPLYNLGRVQAGTPIQLRYQAEDSSPFRIVFTLDPKKSLVLSAQPESNWQAQILEAKMSKKLRTFQGTVRSSLWESASESGLDPIVVGQLAEVFAWQIDFSREVRRGDRWRLAIREIFADDKPIGWGEIVVAEYLLQKEKYTAVLFKPSKDDRSSYFAPDGESMRKLFLKSPIRFARISSRFQRRRFHPILKRNIPHRGVDYAAPRGTPIRAVGDGRIKFAGRKRAAGKYIRIRHNSVYDTGYSHLSRIKKGIRSGRKVKQGETIGYVGSTGLATGPHLHFTFFRYGKYVDPLGVKFPSANPVAKADLPEFLKVAKESLALLPEWSQSHAGSESKKRERVARSENR